MSTYVGKAKSTVEATGAPKPEGGGSAPATPEELAQLAANLARLARDQRRTRAERFDD